MAWMTAGPAGGPSPPVQAGSRPDLGQDQPADWDVANFIDGNGVGNRVVDIFARDAMTQGRAENLH